MSEPMDTTGASATTGQNVFLTQDQLNQLLSLIDNNQSSAPVTLRPPPSGIKKASPWPEWDSTKELYHTYIMQLTNKIESDWDLMGGHKSVCMDMMTTLPKNLRSRVSCRTSTGRPNADWNYEQFIVHFNDNFEAKTSSRVAEVRTISGKLESRENYVPKHGPKQTKTWYISRLGNAPSNVESATYIPQSIRHETPPLPVQDADGDTLTSGINGVSSSTIAAIINAANSQNISRNDNSKKKSPAPWRSAEMFAALRGPGKCTRCARKRHWFKKCPNFAWTERPAVLNTTSSKGKNMPKYRLENFDDENDENNDSEKD
ncbi:hypothetical protein K3495_g396 [Podosphaera aphanis]|nr:hypothetical protein K3495_g396 [Podosphaera aphanis]